MRKLAIVVAVAMAASAPTAAFAAKKKAGPKVYDTTAANQNESAARFLVDGFWNLGVKCPSCQQAFAGKTK
jgi:hypothetical protein